MGWNQIQTENYKVSENNKIEVLKQPFRKNRDKNKP